MLKLPHPIPRELVKAGVTRYGRWLMPRSQQRAQEHLEALASIGWMQPIVAQVQAELYPPQGDIESTQPDLAPKNTSIYPRYGCHLQNPLNCSLCHSLSPTGDRVKTCSICNFPTLLALESEIQGQRSSYRIERWLGQLGNGRLYAALQQGSNQPVALLEYILPSAYFNREEARQQQQAFKDLAGLRLADGRSQDSRVLQPLDAIADPVQARCYLVLDAIAASPSLERYLDQGALSEAEVRFVLNQVLQSLESLHGHKFQLPSGQILTGLAHGQIGLQSLLASQALASQALASQPLASEALASQPTASQPLPRLLDSTGFIYLGQIALWESLFDPARLHLPLAGPAQDLVDLGQVALALLTGTPNSAQEVLDSQDQAHWPPIEPALKQFIARLLGLGAPFASAELARRELLQFAPINRPGEEGGVTTAPAPAFQKRGVWLWSLLGLGILGLGGLLWWWRQRAQEPEFAPTNLAKLQDVAGIPPGRFTYTAATDGIWSYVLKQPDLIEKGRSLEQILQDSQPKLQLNYQPVKTPEAAIAQVQSGQSDFAVMPVNGPLPPELRAEAIAYDGVAVVVAFSYSNRDKSLPRQLRGEIALEDLQQLYRGQVFNWQALGAAALPIQLYQPDSQEVMQVFEQQVLQASLKLRTPRQGPLTKLPELALFRNVIQDFEAQNIGGIGFSTLSKVVGQCSVYPLAIKLPQQQAVQPVVLNNQRAIAPQTDLCDKKGQYRPSPELLKTGRYPLAYPIAVVYPHSNNRPAIGQKFAELLKTQEGQEWLQKTGLVPLN
jgi:ABC-type phosphate transport system substrate-binding protein